MEENEYSRIVRNINNEQNYKIENGLLYRIRNDRSLRIVRKHEFEGIMYIAHDIELSGHFGMEATYERIKDRYYWDGMKRDVETYVKSCDSCQRRGKPIGKHELNVIKVKEPFYQIGIDVVGPLPITEKG